MYQIYADGELICSPYKEEYTVISPSISKDVNKAGSFTFTLPPSHPFYDRMQKLKTMLTVYQDEEMIFRGRVLSFETDFYKRRTVYCEGELAYLNDSVCRPYTFNGTASGLFTKHINDHNDQVDAAAQFTIGSVTVTGTVDVKITEYASTWESIESMIESFGGYLYIRHEDGARIIDYLADAEETDTQTIQFGQNLLDITEHITAEDVFTVLIPLGSSSSKSPLTIKSVNNNKDYIQDDTAVALFGKIWKTHQWNDIKNATKLLAKGQAYLQKGIAEALTLNISAVDLHLVDVDTDRIEVGRKIRVKSEPHGLDADFVCSAVTLDLVNLDRSTYTFGNPKNTATGVMVTAKTTGSRAGRRASNTEDQLDGVFTDITQADGHINLLAKQLNGDVAVNWASLDISPSTIVSKVGADGIVSMINQSASTVMISAEHIELDGYVTADDLSAEVASAMSALAANFHVGQLTIDDSIQGDFYIEGLGDGDMYFSQHSHEVTVTSNGKLQLGGVVAESDPFDIADTQFYKNGVSAAHPNSGSLVSAVWDTENEEWQVNVKAQCQDGYSKTLTVYHTGRAGESKTFTQAKLTIGSNVYTNNAHTTTLYGSNGTSITIKNKDLSANQAVVVYNTSTNSVVSTIVASSSFTATRPFKYLGVMTNPAAGSYTTRGTKYDITYTPATYQ